MEAGLTVHCMVRNEPFVYYAVKSVYDYADQILLYDTGSYDEYTLSDVALLMREDFDDKITFKQVTIEVDETKWSDRGPNNYRVMAKANRGKRGKWYCRQMQIHDTETRYFMILDGDEVHYRSGMETILKTVRHWPREKLCGSVPLLWFKDLAHVFQTSRSGRVFVTEQVGVIDRSPGELHTVKKTGEKIGHSSRCTFAVPEMTPFAHFETWLKPWRRVVPASKIRAFTGKLPEVMQENMSFVERFSNADTSD